VLESCSGLRFPPAAVARASTPVCCRSFCSLKSLPDFDFMTEIILKGLSQAREKE